MDYLAMYKKILKEFGLTGKDISGLMGFKYASYRTMTKSRANTVPKWVRSFVICYMYMGGSKKSTATQCKCNKGGCEN